MELVENRIYLTRNGFAVKVLNVSSENALHPIEVSYFDEDGIRNEDCYTPYGHYYTSGKFNEMDIASEYDGPFVPMIGEMWVTDGDELVLYKGGDHSHLRYKWTVPAQPEPSIPQEPKGSVGAEDVPSDGMLPTPTHPKGNVVTDTLKQRGSVYGSFRTQVDTVGGIVELMIEAYKDSHSGDEPERALQTQWYYLAIKMARMATSPRHTDNAHDLAGYATLCEKWLDEEWDGRV